MRKKKINFRDPLHYIVAAWCPLNDTETRVWLARMADIEPVPVVKRKQETT